MKVLALPFRLVCVTLLLCLTLPTDVRSDVLIDFDFETDGVLPSSDPEVYLFNNTPFSETDLYSVQNGLLEQRTIDARGNASYLYPETINASPFDSTYHTSMEARLRINEVDRSQRFGVYFGYFDGSYYYNVDFDPSNVYANTSEGILQSSFTPNEFHVFRIESNKNNPEFTLFVDGIAVLTADAGPLGGSFGVGFGDGRTPAGDGRKCGLGLRPIHGNYNSRTW